MERGAGVVGIAAHSEHRRPGGRLHRAGRQDHPSPQGIRETGLAPGAGHDRSRGPHRPEAHLAKRGYGDIEVRMTGGYDPTSTPGDSALIRAQQSVYRQSGLDPLLWPRGAGSWPGYVFTDAPLHLAAGHFGLGHGSGAHAPDEYYVIESANPKIEGMDGAAFSFVEYLFELAVAN